MVFATKLSTPVLPANKTTSASTTTALVVQSLLALAESVLVSPLAEIAVALILTAHPLTFVDLREHALHLLILVDLAVAPKNAMVIWSAVPLERAVMLLTLLELLAPLVKIALELQFAPLLLLMLLLLLANALRPTAKVLVLSAQTIAIAETACCATQALLAPHILHARRPHPAHSSPATCPLPILPPSAILENLAFATTTTERESVFSMRRDTETPQTPEAFMMLSLTVVPNALRRMSLVRPKIARRPIVMQSTPTPSIMMTATNSPPLAPRT